MLLLENANLSKMETFWQEQIHPDKFLSKRSRGDWGKAGGGERGALALLVLGVGGWQGWCPGGSGQSQLPAVQSQASFLTFKIREKGLKHEPAAGARRRGLGTCPRSPQPRVWKSWGGPAGGSLGSAQTPPDGQLRQLRMSSSRASF